MSLRQSLQQKNNTIDWFATKNNKAVWDISILLSKLTNWR